MQSMLCGELESRGYKARVLSIDHVNQLQQDIKEALEINGRSESFCSFIGRCLDFNLPDTMQNIRSIIVCAAPSSRARVFFNHKGKRHQIFIPPTYVDMFSASEKMMKQIKAILEPCNYNVIKAGLPNKLLAVRSGLGHYGRNNICYIPGMGSFARLAAFYSDMPCEEDNWYEAKQMETCHKCSACSKNCPTGSVKTDVRLINAERCICNINEHRGDFPNWMEPQWHNSLVGCFKCQEVCPENKDFIGNIVDIGEFSDEETDILLQGVPLEAVPPETKVKLEKMNMVVYYSCLPRNLRVLLEQN